MSNVTNAIVVCADEEDLKKLNAAIGDSQGGQQFVNPNEVVPNGEWCGGHKNLEVAVGICAFNYLDKDALLRAFRAVEWTYLDTVQLFLKGQNDKRFTVYELDAQRTELTGTSVEPIVAICVYKPTVARWRTWVR